MGVSWVNGARDLMVLAIEHLGLPMTAIKMADMGDQRIKVWRRSTKEMDLLRVPMQWFGAEYVSFDLHGKWGALPYDLGVDLFEQGGEQHRGHYNIVANFGTLEHVQDSQEIAFRNMHELCEPGGMMVHMLPHTSFIHGDWQYDRGWVRHLARRQGYEILTLGHSNPRRIWRTIPPECRPEKRVKIRGKYMMAVLRHTGQAWDSGKWNQPTKSPKEGRRWKCSKEI